MLVGRQFEGEVGQAVLRDDVIDRYQKAGVVVDKAGSFADIQQTRVQGDGPISTNAQNGIQVSRGADADVFKNIVTDNVYSPATDSASGLIIFGTSGLAIKDNYVARNDLDIAGVGNFGPLTNSVIEKNQALNATYDGIYMDEGTANNTLSQNFLRTNGVDCEDRAGHGRNRELLAEERWPDRQPLRADLLAEGRRQARQAEGAEPAPAAGRDAVVHAARGGHVRRPGHDRARVAGGLALVHWRSTARFITPAIAMMISRFVNEIWTTPQSR